MASLADGETEIVTIVLNVGRNKNTVAYSTPEVVAHSRLEVVNNRPEGEHNRQVGYSRVWGNTLAATHSRDTLGRY